MQLSHEPENEGVLAQAPSLSIDLKEAQRHESAVVNQFCWDWKKGDYKNCLSALKSLPPLTLPESITDVTRCSCSCYQ